MKYYNDTLVRKIGNSRYKAASGVVGKSMHWNSVRHVNDSSNTPLEPDARMRSRELLRSRKPGSYYTRERKSDRMFNANVEREKERNYREMEKAENLYLLQSRDAEERKQRTTRSKKKPVTKKPATRKPVRKVVKKATRKSVRKSK